jgi:BirA family transcriptional regulator, biotin operon repressor / biotin---[acetyl-CoA-carboxylase] ligase
MASDPKGQGLPAGHRLLRLDVLDSTNAEARRRAEGGEAGPLWIWANRQSNGRGRNGRSWQSESGNLFASLVLRLDCTLQTAGQLALLAGIAAHETVKACLPQKSPSGLLLKWPNDVLVSGGKIAGVLLESIGNGAQGQSTIIIGTGINLASHPDGLLQPATSLAAFGPAPDPALAFEKLAQVTQDWLSLWDQGARFQTIRRAWLERAGPTGKPLRVRLHNEETEGLFGGIDAQGALRLIMQDGVERRVAAGDVFFAAR